MLTARLRQGGRERQRRRCRHPCRTRRRSGIFVEFTLNGETMTSPIGSAREYVVRLIVGLILVTPVVHAQGKSVKLALSSEPAEEVSAKEGDVIPDSLRLPGSMLPIASSVSPPRAREERTVRPWWIGFELGDGQIKLTSDQFSGTRNPAFALGFVGGHSLGNRARIGLELNGWLLQSFNNNNPAVGESVSNVLGVVDAFPIRKAPIFLRAGAGLALYTNNRPTGFNSNGWSWTAAAGYEIPVTENLGLTPIVGYAAGSLGDVRNIITVQTGRRYSAVEFKAAIIWHFGRPK